MVTMIRVGVEFFRALEAVDARLAAEVGGAGCPRCGGRLHQSNYWRKPRGGLVAPALCPSLRLSFCCGREGCRRRATPPSVRFLGRRVYWGAVVIVASVVSRVTKGAPFAPAAAEPETGVPRRTRRRWVGWWRGTFPSSAVFVAVSGRLVPAVARDQLPGSLLERMEGEGLAPLGFLLRWLTPLTTRARPDAARGSRETRAM